MNEILNEYYLRIIRDEHERTVERLQMYRLAKRAKRQEARAKAPRRLIWPWLRFLRRARAYP